MSSNKCIIKYNVQEGMVVSNDTTHSHNVSIPANHLSATLFGVGRKGKYTKVFKVGDRAEYASDERFSYYGEIKEIGNNHVIIATGSCDVTLSMSEFSIRNHSFDEDEASSKNLANMRF